MQRGFSLVELSIVLVILGLLTGGILAGQSLIRASELRAVTSEYQRYAAATNNFRDKYFAVPGDFNKAESFWGQSTACSGASATGACNGDGDGVFDGAAVAGGASEPAQFWRQLALAGLIEGTYSGTAYTTNDGDNPGTNTPRSKYGQAGWGAHYRPNFPGDTLYYALDYGNLIDFGVPAYAGSWLDGATLKPEDAWNIDTKMDDGLPGSGKIIGITRGWYHAVSNPSACVTSTAFTDKPGAYNLTVATSQCALAFIKQF